ncbi:putative butyrate kinase 1 [Candidatus Zixiibacteriota bacterium]|nr:putative butyrate kinase 1 [candidate division Zixibacteria bacterium]
MEEIIIVINPGSTSTKMALFRKRDKIAEENVTHPSQQLAGFDNVADQFELRMKGIEAWLSSQKIESKKVVAVAGRGAPLRPLEGGAYWINERMLDDIRKMKYSNHASNLGAVIADHFGRKYNVPAIIADPVTTDNFTDLARISGIPEIERKCRAHTLNIKEVCRRLAAQANKQLEECNFVAVHMGGGISVAAVQGGKIIDVNDALLGMGPFSPDRAGALPIGALVKLACSGKFTEKDLTDKLSRKSGLMAYLGQSDLREVEKMIDAGDKKAETYFRAMAYQISKEIGMYATVLKGKYNAIVLTGGMAKSERLVSLIREQVSFLGDIAVVPGEFEMEALAEWAARVLDNKETPKEY